MKNVALGALFVGLMACGGGGGSNDGIVLPDSDGTMIDGSATCNPLMQTGCADGQKCAWVQETADIGYLDCVADGTVAIGGACTLSGGMTGSSNCVKGSECVAGVCKQICDDQGGAPTCDAQHACGRYDGLFEVGEETVAGVCDPKCDPLTQNLLAGTNVTACGSPTPAMPENGCYTFDYIDFTCAPSGDLTKTDRVDAAIDGVVYVNSCAPGYMPFFRESTGSNVTVCAGLCAPAKTDTTRAGNVDGNTQAMAKLVDQPAPRVGDATCGATKKGSGPGSECLYLWPFLVENGMLSTSQYNDTLGVCFDPGQYTYDDDNDTGTPNIGVPSCATLPPRDQLPANCTCDAMGSCTGTGCPHGAAHEWGCWPSADSMFTSNGQAPATKAATQGLRVSYGTGMVFRHALVD